jgi:hypothetical protein
VSLAANEVPAILQFAAELAHSAAQGGKLRFHSRPNLLRNAFELGWIEKWIADGFLTKPPDYRQEWAALYRMSLERGIGIEFDDLTKAVEQRLEQALGKRAAPPRSAPGDPVEDPWG